MSDKPAGLLDEHSYDGIQEYDNPLPGWWKWLFALTTVFAIPYWIWFHLGTPGRSIHEQYDSEMARIFELRFSEIGELEPDRATIMKYLNEPKWLKVGEVTFKTNCATCHGQGGEGNVGSNLTDDNWKNVAHVEDIARVIHDGAAGGAMPAWGKRLSHQNLIVLTAAYVASLRGQNLPGKAPEPESRVIPPWIH